MTKSHIKMLSRWIDIDGEIESEKRRKREMVMKIDADIKALEKERDDIRAAFDAEMKQNGVLEDVIQGRLHNYKIAYQQQAERVVVESDAVPDDFCKIERKPMLKEIKEHLQAGNQTNWARLERSEPKLNWKMIKKG